MSLAQSRFECIFHVACWLGSCLGNLPLYSALVGKRGRLLKLSRVTSLGREVELLVLGWSPLAAKSVLACGLAHKPSQK